MPAVPEALLQAATVISTVQKGPLFVMFDKRASLIPLVARRGHLFLASLLRGVRRAKRSVLTAVMPKGATKVNLCSGTQRIAGYFGVDFSRGDDLRLDLSRNDLPFRTGSLEAVICISAINYFTRSRAQEIVHEVYRVLKPGGITRFGVQDMEAIARRYVSKDRDFFFQKLPDGRDRFEGPTLGDKFAAWFYGYAIKSVPCQYFYDYDALAYLFRTAGFSTVERKNFQESRLDDIGSIDNRPDQMFFLEAIK